MICDNLAAARSGSLARSISDEAVVKELAALYGVGFKATDFRLTKLISWMPLYDVVQDGVVRT